MDIGSRCEIPGKRRGQVAYVGPVDGIPAGEWVGVRLDLPFGKNDGSHAGKRYFDADPMHGVFVRPESVNISEAFPPLLVVNDELSLEEKVRVVEDARALQRESAQRKQALNTKDTLAASIESFWKDFTELETQTRSKLDALANQGMNMSVREEVEILLGDTNQMREMAATASLYLPPYDIRQSQNILTRLRNEIDALRNALAPRKKFTFKARAKKATAAETSTQVVKNLAEPEFVPQALENELIYADKTDEVIVITAQDAPDLTLTRLTNCVVCIPVPTSAVRATHLSQCHVFTGPIQGSLWLEDCTKSTFTVACRQLRVHHSHQTNFFLRIKSHPIIEDCTKLGFAPYSMNYEGLDVQLKSADMETTTTLWSQVHDFKWHRAQQSPNWRLLSEEEIKKHPSDGRGRTYVHFE
ncbi:tubulin-specific chaperone C [Thraustotheca clavata]|uniref:Tubulin-specific chaperone C n=1 Tax=Thraustotheca clavata TaxID=74557 RepID=A0A1V9ZCK7_9STRA|nr:tubulin-specific chaperone C [Thraustotheca clavata]